MANRFWVGGSGDWDASTTTHWAISSGAAGGASVPGSGDTVTFDGASGGGTVTPTVDITVQSITCGAFTGTLDWSVNNKNVSLSSINAFSGSGTGARTIKLGNGTWTFTATATGNRWNMTTTTNLTFDAGASVLAFTGVGSTAGALAVFIGGGLTYNALSLSAQPNGAVFQLSTGGTSYGSLTVAGPNIVQLSASPQTIDTLTLNGTAAGPIMLRSATDSVSRTLSVASNAPTMTYCAFRDITCSGGASFVASNSFDLGNNSGITINPPSGGGHVASRQQLGM